MATTIDTLLVRIEGDMSDLRRDLARIEKTTEKTTNSMQKSFKRVGAAMAAVGGAAAVTGLVKSFIQTGAEVENLSVRFNTLFGSLDQGAIAFQAITKYASEVPFSLQDIQRGAAPLATVAKDANMMGDALLLTGNIAAASGLSFEEASQNVQRALSAGINSAELFRERGVSAMAGFEAGTSYNVQETLKKLQAAFGEGGEFDGITNDLAKTTDGALSMLGDSLFTFRKTVAESGANDGFKDLIKEIKSLIDGMRPLASLIGRVLGSAFRGLAVTIRFVVNLFDELRITILVFMGLGLTGTVVKMAKSMAALARITIINRNLFAQLNAVVKKNPFVLFAVGATLLAEKTGLISKSLEELERRFPNFFGGLAEAADAMANNFSLGLDTLNEEMQDALNVPLTIAMGGASDAAKVAEKQLQNLKSLISGTTTPTEQLSENIVLLEDHLKSAGEDALPLASEALARLKHEMASAEPMMQTLNTSVQSLAAGISSSFADALVDGQVSLESLQDIFKGFVKAIVAQAIQLFFVNRIMNAIFGRFDGYTPMPTASFTPKATGGPVRQGSPYLVGERGPELFVPQGAGSVVNAATTRGLGGGGGIVINQNFNVSTGVQQTVRNEIRQLMPQIADNTRAAVADAKRRGGSYGKAFA